MKTLRLRGVAALACALALAGAARRSEGHAQGTIFSSPVDGDGLAVFWNPAAMAASTTSRIDLVGNISIPQSSYQRDGIDTAQTGRPFPRVSLVSVRPEPAAGLVIDKLWHKRLRIGIAFTVPSAAGAAWPETVTDTNGQQVLGPTRYHVTDAQIFTALAQLGASIALHPTFAIGASVNVAFSSINVDKHIDLANQPGIRELLPCGVNPIGCESAGLSTPLNLSGKGVSAGGSVGIMWQPIPRLRFGVAYLSPIKVPLALTLTIDAQKLNDFIKQFLPGFSSLVVNGAGSADMTLPQRVHFAVAVDVHPRVELMLWARWVNNSATEIIAGGLTNRSSTLVPDSLRIASVKNDEWTVALRVLGRIRERWKLAASLEYVTRTVPEAYMTPSNLDFDSIALNLGAQVRAWRRLYVGLSFSQFFVFPRRVDSSAFSNDSPEPYNLPNPAGDFTANSERVGIDIAAAF
jgi:long-subunit fatty acid transport protein